MTTTPEFTDDELATLRRFDATPNARHPFPEEPLTPTGPIVYPNELIPHPMAEAEGATSTALEWARAEGARAWAQRRLVWHLLNTGPRITDQTPEQTENYLAEHHQWIDGFTVWFLLRHVSDEVVRDLSEILAAGDCLDELLWDWLDAQGIDAKRIRSFPAREEAIAIETERRAALAPQAGEAKPVKGVPISPPRAAHNPPKPANYHPYA